MNKLIDEMMKLADPEQVAGLSRFFKTGPGQYGEGDKFLGIKVPRTREVVRAIWKEVTFAELEECISNGYHEIRLAALLVLVRIFKHAGKDFGLKQRCVEFYLQHTDWINNWDLVDLSCYEILGPFLLDKDRSILYEMARDGRTIWERRIGIVSTMVFIRAGQIDDTFAIADILLQNPSTQEDRQSKPGQMHDLLQKAAGWLLRETMKVDEARLKDWLETRCATMPRTMLRYAIEKFTPEERARFT